MTTDIFVERVIIIYIYSDTAHIKYLFSVIKKYTSNNKSLGIVGFISQIKVITKLPNSEQSYKGKVKTHNYINRQNQSNMSVVM
jgi:hypothetical protein